MSEWDSEHYKKHAQAQMSASLQTIQKISFQGKKKILDIGCGDGKITHEIATRVPEGEVIGIDISDNMLALAKKNYASIKHLQFLKNSAETFFFEKPFDLITSFFALHWVKDHRALLQNCSASLTKGGSIHFLMVSGSDPRVQEVLTKDFWKRHLKDRPNPFQEITRADYLSWLSQMAFQQVQVEEIYFSYPFESIEKLALHTLTWLPFVTGWDRERSFPLAKEIAENIAKGQSKTIELKTKMLLVRANKK